MHSELRHWIEDLQGRAGRQLLLGLCGHEVRQGDDGCGVIGWQSASGDKHFGYVAAHGGRRHIDRCQPQLSDEGRAKL